MKAQERISMPAIIKMRREIQDAGENEVFFVGQINENSIVTSIKACARGNEHSVDINFTETREPCVFIHNHPGGDLTPSGADLAAASRANENSCGFFIVDNEVQNVYVVMEPVPPKKLEKLDPDQAASCIMAGGALQKNSDFFEERPSQVELLKSVARAFNQNSVAAFEAGTGVGKSFAYLVPAMLWAAKNKERVVVSTGTINLQQQLSEKDIPAAKKILGLDIKAVLLKGRNNYICLRRLEEIKKERDLFTTEVEALEKISEWAASTANGSKSDLSFNPSEGLWGRLCSESDACMGLHCPYRDKCFVMAARREASDAQLLVVNHHLLFADIESRMNAVGYDDAAVLPPYKRIVFDEAHGIESAATSFFSEQVTRFKIFKQMNLLYRERRSSLAGYVFTLTALCAGADNTEKIGDSVARVKDCVASLETAALDLMQNEWTSRLCERTAAAFSPVISLLTSLGGELSRLVALVRELCDSVPDEDKTENAYWESRAILRRLEDAAGVCKDFVYWNEKQDQVFWIQRQRLSEEFVKDGSLPFYVTFTRTPLDIAPLMNTGVFEPMESVVCASATLKIAGSFDFWTRRTGLAFVEESRLKSAAFDSPFPYDKNVLLACPSDMPFPDNIEFQRYVEMALIKLIKASKGRALVLFTSYDSLKSAASTCQYELAKNGINVMKQGDDDRFRLLDKFKGDEASALFATDSFWQGIDVPGSSLSQVIIVKLPFSVPNDPVFAARAEEVERRGGSSFMELSLPEAVIKFRQGFGRLARRSTDKGAVIVLDRRVMEKRYGKTFLDSLPQTKRLYAPLNEVAAAVERILE